MEERKFLQVISAAKSSSRCEHELPDGVRVRICRAAAEQVLRGRSPWFLPLPPFPHPARVAIFGAAATLSAALVILPMLRQSPPPDSQEEVRAISVVAEGGFVKLAWSDGEKGSYTVYKTSDPRDFAQAEVHTVNGRTTWTDTDPGSSSIVFYRIE